VAGNKKPAPIAVGSGLNLIQELKLIQEEIQLDNTDVVTPENADSTVGILQCEQCGEPLQPRAGSGGEPQRFCGEKCRQAFHRRATVAQEIPTVAPPSPPNQIRDPGSDFDWSGEHVIIEEQPAIAVYFNAKDGLVIRQHQWPDDDTTIIINKDQIDVFLDKLTDACGIPSMGRP